MGSPSFVPGLPYAPILPNEERIADG